MEKQGSDEVIDEEKDQEIEKEPEESPYKVPLGVSQLTIELNSEYDCEPSSLNRPDFEVESSEVDKKGGGNEMRDAVNAKDKEVVSVDKIKSPDEGGMMENLSLLGFSGNASETIRSDRPLSQ